MTTPENEPGTDPAKFFADMFAAGQEQMRQLTAATSGLGAPGSATSPSAAQDPTSEWLAASQRLAEMQQDYVKQIAGFWLSGFGMPLGIPPAVAGGQADKRFAAEAWSKDPRFDSVRQAYLAYSNYIMQSVESAPVDERMKGQLRFAARQFTDAMSPANFFVTNPDAMNLAMETGGKSVADGMKLFFEDFAKGRITMTDESMFEVGRNLAITPGAVVYENELFQLIQYTAAEGKVFERPLLIVPPCINKFYILDLQPENSFVRYAVEQGHTVFMMSWRNASEEQGKLTWDDYLKTGIMQALDLVLEITRADKANTLGFCIGGTLLASAIAVMKTNDENKVASITLLTAMLDFSDAGEIGVLVDDQAVTKREQTIGQGGLLHGKELAFVFSSLRANDLIWPYVVNSYLKGKAPPAFDMLYWNSDATNLPGPMFCWYVRNTYLENNLRDAGKTVQCGVPVDLSDIDVPAYLYASREDHIVPWTTAYRSSEIVSGDTTFVLGASGHIAGVINSPSKNKRNYWIGGAAGASAEQWLASAQEVPGSWWPNWSGWLATHAGQRTATRRSPGSKRHRAIEAAPGRYVKAKAE